MTKAHTITLRNMSREKVISALKAGGSIVYCWHRASYRVRDSDRNPIGSLLYTTFGKLKDDGLLVRTGSNYNFVDIYELAE